MDRRIIILGFMGCGKTTVATELARQLECRFIDLDSFITDSQGRSPAEIIEQDGEALPATGTGFGRMRRPGAAVQRYASSSAKSLHLSTTPRRTDSGP